MQLLFGSTLMKPVRKKPNVVVGIFDCNFRTGSIDGIVPTLTFIISLKSYIPSHSILQIEQCIIQLDKQTLQQSTAGIFDCHGRVCDNVTDSDNKAYSCVET